MHVFRWRSQWSSDPDPCQRYYNIVYHGKRLVLTCGHVLVGVLIGLVGATQRADGRYDQCVRVHRHRLIVDGLVGLHGPPVHDASDPVPPGAGHQNRVVPATQPFVRTNAVLAVAVHRRRQIIVFGVERVLRLVVERHRHVAAYHRYAIGQKKKKKTANEYFFFYNGYFSCRS